jgi:hypothetical protein
MLKCNNNKLLLLILKNVFYIRKHKNIFIIFVPLINYKQFFYFFVFECTIFMNSNQRKRLHPNCMRKKRTMFDNNRIACAYFI